MSVRKPNKLIFIKKYIALILCITVCSCCSTSAHAFTHNLTSECKFTASEGPIGYLIDTNISTSWLPKSHSAVVDGELPDDKKTDGIYIKWHHTDTPFVLKAFDTDGNLVTKYTTGDLCDSVGCFYPVSDKTKRFEIEINKADGDFTKYGINYITVAEEGYSYDHNEHQWCSDDDHVDALIVPCHQDDEFVYFGGLIPSLINQGKKVEVAYAANCGRYRYECALDGLWYAGVRYAPDFMNFPDRYRTYNIDSTKKLWGDEDYVVGKFVELIRKRRPEVIFSHDINGERIHGGHQYVSYALREAVIDAADPTKYTDSAKKYGVWETKKLFLHLYNKNTITLNYDTPLSSYNNSTAYQIACKGLSYHVSETSKFHVELNSKYDSRKWGLFYSTVGYDTSDIWKGI